MASTAAVASSSSTTLESRPQAGPLPSKRGEIGFVEGVHEQAQEPSQMVDQVTLPARHPADVPIPSPSQDTVDVAPSRPDTSQTVSDGNSVTSVGKPFLGHKTLPKFLGVHFSTVILLGAQLLVFVGTVIGWVFADDGSNDPPPGEASNGDQNFPQGDAGTSHIFIHVAFAVLALAQLVFIERRIFRARAERYAFKHPGEMLPSALRRGRSANASIGVGTGDVEDAAIAPPPPPAYGKTRGSTLLLAGYLRNSLREQARLYEEDRRRRASASSGMSVRSDRPVSFVSQDEEWEVRRDADRARRIEEALAALENNTTGAD
ncbi:hypothetical protein BJV77DRAFT_1061774 [Russula vinacea]|nr:hypothetical protein BJV77DRAFT_1061774 [Russula vinacea]